MKFVWSALIPFLVSFLFLNSERAYAQLDSSYELLLGVPVPKEASPVPPLAPPAAKKSLSKRKVASEPNVEVSGSKAGSHPFIDTSKPLPVKLEPASGESAATEPEPSFSDQAQSLFTAQPEKVLTYYHDQFDVQDPRQNKVEIIFAPTFVTNESSSNYSYRNYRSVFSAVAVGANVWLTPAIGLGGTFLFSLGGDTSGDAATGARSPARHELFELALKLRQFFGFSSHSKSVEFDFLFSDYKFNVPSDDLYRPRLKTSGLGLKTSLRIPTSPDVAWLVGGSFYPRLQHNETAAGANISSGENAENTRIGLHLGSELILSKESQIFWETSASSERNLFGGSASLVDSATGGLPKNVSVTNTFYMMTFGYRWGN
jgi:hypothetical protein